MKKFIFLIVFLAVVAGVLIATCPDRNAHMEHRADRQHG